MTFVVTVIDTTAPGRNTTRDIAVDIEDGLSFGTFARRIELRRTATWWCQTVPLCSDSIVGVPPLVHGAVITSEPRQCSETQKNAGGKEIRVVGGPDAGGTFPLGDQDSVFIGRSPECDLSIDDPWLPRHYGTIRPDLIGATILMLNSYRGVFADNVHLNHDTERSTLFSPDAVIRLGRSEIALAIGEEEQLKADPNHKGRLIVSSPPRIRSPASLFAVSYPAKPQRRASISNLMMILPALVTTVVFSLTVGGSRALWVIAITPLGIITTVAVDRLLANRSYQRASCRYRKEIATLNDNLAAAQSAEVALRRRESPDAAMLLRITCGPTARLWERRLNDDDYLQLRLGTGKILSKTTTITNFQQSDVGPSPTILAPVNINFNAVRVLGISYADPRLLSVMRFIIAQLAVLHSPEGLRIIVITDSTIANDWAWVRWLPHLGENVYNSFIVIDCQDAHQQISDLKSISANENESQKNLSQHIVAVFILAQPRYQENLTRSLLQTVFSYDFLAIFCCPSRIELPVECSAIITASPNGDLNYEENGQPPITKISGDGISITRAEALARSQARLLPASRFHYNNELPAFLSLAEISDVILDDSNSILTFWSNGPNFSIPIGVTSSGKLLFDITSDGPHALIAGTTGAGKSELLRSIVVGLAATNSPHHLSFILVDYKGGGTFGPCARLPHVLGVLTDLDHYATERAVKSLRHETLRRERLFATVGCSDLTEYIEAHPSRTGLNRIVIIIDEFATLKEEMPDLLKDIIDIAVRGRSLGLHLILSTQRPTGSVGPDIRANTSARIALRTLDSSDSNEIIGSALAANISRDLPGRGIIRLGTDPPITFQACRVSELNQFEISNPVIRSENVWQPLSDSSKNQQISTIETVVGAIVKAGHQIDLKHNSPLWCPPLPPRIDLNDLLDRQTTITINITQQIYFALADSTVTASQYAIALKQHDGNHLIVAGGGRSGKSTTLITLANSISRSNLNLYFYILNCGGELASQEKLYRCGTAVRSEEIDLGIYLISKLEQEMNSRYRNHAEQRFINKGNLNEDERPWIFVIIDDWELFAEIYSGIDHEKYINTIYRILRDGSAVGITVLLSGGRAVLSGRMATIAAERLVLRMNDSQDFSLAGISPACIPKCFPPGRGILLSAVDQPPIEIQVAVAQQSAPIKQNPSVKFISTAPPSSNTCFPPIKIRRLPLRITVRELPSREESQLSRIPIGIGWNPDSPISIDLIGEHGLLVLGPRGSGRTTTLTVVAAGLSMISQPCLVIGKNLPQALNYLTRSDGLLRTAEPDDVQHVLATINQTEHPMTVLVDNVETITDTPMEHALLGLLQRSESQLKGLLVTGSTDMLTSGFHGIVGILRRREYGILLPGATRTDAEMLGVTTALGGIGFDPPGRSWLVKKNRLIRVQIAVTS
jgi:DNA segregation ATPase FtsK/SpoIIIE, S-DNA-T family